MTQRSGSASLGTRSPLPGDTAHRSAGEARINSRPRRERAPTRSQARRQARSCAARPACNYGRAGGYGGGGGSGCNPNICNYLHTGGGGDGYSGGGAGGSCYYFGGGGGGSYNVGMNQDNEAGVKTGNGQVVISW